MGNCDLSEVPKYIDGFIEYKHRFNETIAKYISNNSDTFAKSWLIGYKIKGENNEKIN